MLKHTCNPDKITFQLAARTGTRAVKLGEHGHPPVSRQNANADDNHVSFVGIPDAPDLIPTNQGSPRQTYAQLTHLCSGCRSVLNSGHACAPATRLFSTAESESNRFPLASGATHKTRQSLKMPAHIPNGNTYFAVTSSVDNNRLPISPPDYSSLSPSPRFTCTEKHARTKIIVRPFKENPSPATPCFQDGANPCCQHSRFSLSQEPQPSISQNRELNNAAHYPEPRHWDNPCVSKYPVHNSIHNLFGDDLRDISSPRTATTETTLPNDCCWHSVNNVGNSIQNRSHKKEMMDKTAACSGASYLSECEPDVWPTSDDNKHSWHIGNSYPGFSLMHNNPREGSEKKSPRQIPSLTSGAEYADSAGRGVDSQNAMDDTPNNGNFIATCSLEEKTKLPGCFGHPVSQTSYIPCFNRGYQQSPDSSAHSCRQGNHGSKPCRRQRSPRSRREFLTTSMHEMCLQNQHHQIPLYQKQHQVPVFEGDTYSCPFQACKDTHLLQNNQLFKTQLPDAYEDVARPKNTSSQQCPSVSNLHHNFLENVALCPISDHVRVNNTRLPSLPFRDYSEDGFPHDHHLQQANPAAEQLNSPAVTRCMSSQRNYCPCYCPLDVCMCKRQIEGSLPCPERQPS